MKRIKYSWFLVLALLLSGCRYGLPADEIGDMMDLNQGWETIVVASEHKFDEIDERHVTFMRALKDTSNWARQSLLLQDTSLRLQVSRLTSNYEGAKRRHIYNLKEMRSFLDASKVWLQRVNTEGMARQLARRSWQARTTTFKSIFARIQLSESAFHEISPFYARIVQLLPSMLAFQPLNL